MSFSVDLWNSYDFCSSHFQLHLRGLKDFIYMLNERYNSEIQNALSLKKISELNYAVTTFDSLLDGIIGFKTDMLNQYNYLIEYLNGIQEEIIIPLNKLNEECNNKINKNINIMKNAERIYNNNLTKLESIKNKFHLSAKEAEIAKITAEISKNSNSNPEIKKKEDLKCQNLLKIAKDNENIYVHSINEVNAVQEDYIEIKKKCLNSIQDLEENLGEAIKDSLRKYVIFQVAYLRNLQYDIDKKAKLMESINIKRDIRNFIDKNFTKDIPPIKYEFIPYKSEFENKKNDKNFIEKFNINEGILDNVKSFITNVFYTEPPISENAFIENKTENELELIAKSSFSNDPIPSTLKDTIFKYLRNRKTRRLLLKKINKIKQNDNNILNDVSYNNLGEILLDCLNILQIDNDYFSSNIVINLAISLYKIKPNEPREFLQNYLKGHTLWRKYDFWKFIIKCEIIEEMHNQKNFNIYNTETREQKDNRIKNIVKNVINKNLYNMISFEIDYGILKEVITYFLEYYEINEEVKNNILNQVNDYVNKKKKEEKEKSDKEKEKIDQQLKENNEKEKKEEDKNNIKQKEEVQQKDNIK